MNHIKDYQGNSVIFGNDFVIKESKDKLHKMLKLYSGGAVFTLAQEPASSDVSFSHRLPWGILADFSKE